MKPWGYTPLRNMKRNKHWWRCPTYQTPADAERAGKKGPFMPLYDWRSLVTPEALAAFRESY